MWGRSCHFVLFLQWVDIKSADALSRRSWFDAKLRKLCFSSSIIAALYRTFIVNCFFQTSSFIFWCLDENWWHVFFQKKHAFFCCCICVCLLPFSKVERKVYSGGEALNYWIIKLKRYRSVQKPKFCSCGGQN
jgi:hypothetical protein